MCFFFFPVVHKNQQHLCLEPLLDWPHVVTPLGATSLQASVDDSRPARPYVVINANSWHMTLQLIRCVQSTHTGIQETDLGLQVHSLKTKVSHEWPAVSAFTRRILTEQKKRQKGLRGLCHYGHYMCRPVVLQRVMIIFQRGHHINKFHT